MKPDLKKKISTTLDEYWEYEQLADIFGEEDVFKMRFDMDEKEEIEYQIEVVVKRKKVLKQK